MYFQCLATHWLEGVQSSKGILFHGLARRLLAFIEIGMESQTIGIHDRLVDYYGKDLSFNSDILDAFSGIFQAFLRFHKGRAESYPSHFYGIPTFLRIEQSLAVTNTLIALGFAWKIRSNSDTYGSDAKLYRPDMHDNPFPSWTWAAFKASRQNLDCGRPDFIFREGGQVTFFYDAG